MVHRGWVDEWQEDGRASFYDPRMYEGTYGGREVESGGWRVERKWMGWRKE